MKKIRGIADAKRSPKTNEIDRRVYVYCDEGGVRLCVTGNEYNIALTLEQARYLALCLDECVTEAEAASK